MSNLKRALAALMIFCLSPASWAQVGNFAIGYVPDAPEDGGFRYLEVSVSEGGLNIHSEASIESQVTGEFARGSVLTNLGCKAGTDRAWCDTQPIAGGTRGFVAAEFLRPAIGPNGAPLRGVDDSALRAGRGDFDAAGQIPCAQHAGQPMGLCDFGVARAGGGDSTVIITKPDGTKRAVFFILGQPISADTSEADYGPFAFSRSNDLSTVTVGTERYEIPDAVTLGG